MSEIMRIRSTLNYGSGGPGLHTMYWQPPAAFAVTADAADAVARVRAMFLAMAALFPTTWSVQVQGDVARIEDTTGGLTGGLAVAPPAAVVGTGGATQSATAAMLLVRLRTNTVILGRLLRGRWYLGPVASAIVASNGQIASANRTIADNAATGTLTGGATASVPVVWHRPTGGAGGDSIAVASFSTWNELAVLRSRRDA
jgi:hypothetical protein